MDAVGPDAALAQVALARDGDEEAFAWIVSVHHADVLRVCFLVAGSRDRAEDAAQSTWAQVWRHLRRLRDPARLRAWILAIAANEARQQERRERVRRLLPHRGSEPFVELDPRNLDLHAALRSLSSDDSRLLALKHVGGLSSDEIGALLHSSPPAIRMRLSRLHQCLRRELGDD
jgi:RNA polymerase sigma-70 factor (ECF subfamily)